MKPESVTALILSAGLSERMGDFKPLMTLGGMTVLERVVRLFQSAGISRVHVVVGHRASETAPIIEHLGARPVANPRYPDGMFSSVKAGVSSLAESTAGFFSLPVDIPLVRVATLRELLNACPDGGSAICYPTFAGRRGHPPLIGRHHIHDILSYCGDGGLAALLGRLQRHAVDVPVVDEFIHADMDSPDDYRNLSLRLNTRECFTPAECGELLERRLNAPGPVVAHGRAVADIALRIGSALNQEAGNALNLHLVCAAALVHDMARREKDHAARGGALLRQLGMPRMAEIVEAHMNVPPAESPRIGEAEVVFLADKLVLEARFVGLGSRFKHRSDEAPADSPAAAAIRARLAYATGLADRIEAEIGRPIEHLVSETPDAEVFRLLAS
jgi:molybdenum cofactor cytidylyltransferase